VLTPARLAGRKKSRALDRKLRRGLARLSGGARASAAGALGAAIRGSTIVRGGRGSLRYQWRFDYDIPDACPDPGPPDATSGKVPVAGVGDLHIVSMQRRGPYRIRTDIIFHLRTDGKIIASRHATLVAALGKSLGPDVLTVRRTQTVLDTRTGRSSDSTVGADIDVFTYAADLREARRMANAERFFQQEEDEPGRDDDGPVQVDNYSALAHAMAAQVGNLIWDLAHQAERFWRTPGQCITLSLNGPSTVSPGDTAQIRAQVASARGYSARQVLGTGLGSATWEDGEVIRGLSARSLLDRLPLPESDPWVEWTAPGTSWPADAKPGFHLTLPTKAGLAKAQILFGAATDAYYQIDKLAYQADHSATVGGMGLPCDTNATTTEKLDLIAGQPFSPDNRLTLDGGAYNGLVALGPGTQAKRFGAMHGCDITEIPPPPCTTTFDQDVPLVLGFVVDIPAGSLTANIEWVLPPIVVGDGGPGSPCYTPTSTAIPNPEHRSVAADDILRPGPHTLTVTRNAAFSGVTGNVAGVTNVSITFHRVNEDGTPYTG
jgi:hypothetical protein